MARDGWILRKLGKAVALYRKHHPDAHLAFYDLPTVMRRDYYRRANRIYTHRAHKHPRRRYP